MNGIRAWHKKGCFDWFLKTKPDIFCIQETKAHPDQIPDEIKNTPGYKTYFDHSLTRKGYSGVGIFTKIEPDKVIDRLGVEELDQEGRFLAAFFKKTIVINTYFPNGGGGPDRLAYKLAYYKAFLKFINAQRKKGFSVIFCGDINTAHTEIDLARPKENVDNTGFLPIERAWIDDLVKSKYIDTFRFQNPNKKDMYSYWDMKTFARERNVGWRIDYFFVSDDLKDKIKDTSIDNSVYGSDHCPISLAINIDKDNL